jgi:hypothetical protein
VLLAPASPAHAGVTLVLPDGTPAAEEQAWLEEAVAPSPPTVVTVHRALCPGTGGRACAMVESPDIYVAGDDDWPWNEANTRKNALLHEVGHMLDRPWTGFPDAARDEFRALIADDRPWRTSPDSPHEKFAEAWRLCALGVDSRSGPDVFGGYDYRPSIEVHLEVCALIAREGAALGWTAGTHPAPPPEPSQPLGAPAPAATAPPVPTAAPASGRAHVAVHAGVLGTAAAGRLQARMARAAVRAAVRRRVPGAHRVPVVCRRLGPRRLRCRFTARHGGLRFTGHGTVSRAAGGGRVRYRLAVRVGRSRRTAWSG